VRTTLIRTNLARTNSEDCLSGISHMKAHCEGCGLDLPVNATAYVCSYECTFCPGCSASMHEVCSHCGGELVRRPRRTSSSSLRDETKQYVRTGLDSWRLWTMNFGAWTFIALAYAATIYQLYRSTRNPMSFLSSLGMQSSQVVGYALLTPFLFSLANRYPFRRMSWTARSIWLVLGGLAFAGGHTIVRGLTPYAAWDPKLRTWVSAVWDSQAHALHIQWNIFRDLFLTNVVDDVVFVYIPILLLAYTMAYYRQSRDREVQTSRLQAQLEKARLQALKSQLQPHFLFNTLNSISALMLTDVAAAERMITLLGDLLRMSLETASTQMTTLSRELEFLTCYIEIEKVRFEERLTVNFDVAPETLQASVPHLLLQPLVDNAIKHGISRLVAGGEIRISAKRDHADLQLVVSDNGPGVRNHRSSSPSGVGLRITRERLETIYGHDQNLELLSLPEGGFTARITIPLRGSFPRLEPLQITSASIAPT
jgi:two-component system, LytTR family, sensor kinase